MTVNRSHLLALLCLLVCFSATAQRKSKNKFVLTEVKPEDFTYTPKDIDSNAEAVILADIGSTRFEGNVQGGLSMIYHRTKRILLINKNAFDKASIELYTYVSGRSEEKISNLSATTYNLADGKIVTTSLNKSSVFKEAYDKKHITQKFTMPDVKEGSIIQYEYTITSPFFANLQPWEFQDDIPTKWSEYSVSIPNTVFDYVIFKKGYLPFTIDTAETTTGVYSIVDADGIEASQNFTLHSDVINARWAIANVPALKDDNYISDLENYKSGIDFQLRRIKYSETHVYDYMSNWLQTVDTLMIQEDFGQPISVNNGWLNDDIKSITSEASNSLEKAASLYDYVKNNFTATKRGMYLEKSLKKVFHDRNGNVAEINMLLVAMMRQAGFSAFPVILSTRDNGWANESYPLISQYNYVVCRVNVDDKYFMLDATNNLLGFGDIPLNCYNGSARVIDKLPVLIPMSTDSLQEKKLTVVSLLSRQNNNISGFYQTVLGKMGSRSFRSKMQSQNAENYFTEIKNTLSGGESIANFTIDSLKKLNAPVAVKYDLSLNFDEDIIYFNPLMGEAIKENPFKSSNRFYPVEMPYCTDETYIFTMAIPDGYKVDEIPKSAKVKLNETDGLFEYLIQQTSTNLIQLRCHLKLNKANFEPEDYETLRNFYSYIVQKEGEQIVLKKI